MTTRTFAATSVLTLLTLRRDRLRLAIWFAALVALPLVTVASFESLYPTQASLEDYARTAGASPAAIALGGPGHGLHTLGGVVVFEIGGFAAIGIALCNVFLVGRNTRAEEELGRVELLRSAVVGRHAPVTATLLVAAAFDVAVGGSIAVALGAQGLPWTGSTTFGAALAAIGIVFAAITAFAAQVADHARGAQALAGGVFGAAYLARAAGDIGDGTLSWFSPVGWAQATRPFGEQRWWPLLLVGALAAACAVGALILESHRDLGEGMLAHRRGPARAATGLTTPTGLAWRLQRSGITGWAVGVLTAGAAMGAAAEQTGGLLADNPDLLAALGGSAAEDLTDVFFRMTALLLALAISGYLVAAVLRARTEEQAGRVEPLLAGAMSRRRWTAAQLTVPGAASVALLAIGSAGAGAGYAVAAGDIAQLPRILGAGMVYLPAVWVFGGLTTALFGAAPRSAPVAWGALAAAATASLLGPAFRLPGWVVDISPFEHAPELPGGEVTLLAPVVMLLLALTLAAAGTAGFAGRDLATS
ncbi:exporter of polyketide antibiotics [Prauserella halophila]|uniref:Exporter of polyketide antibiotics n=1 Tax=Prauserella halophila TaxID=185641 RepID=A0ABN1WME4_9PSEU|nr:ABC transporter permease [Prauserella halophila]MCP2237686.1 ABC-2 type transport system permease protein [Prauserella halophila]